MKTNDARFDGVFFVGVKTTGIYCRPTCRARLPKRENVEFYPTVEAALKKGFRACKRCKPEAKLFIDPKVELVLKASRVIEKADFENLSLEELGFETNSSPTYLQKAFKEILGVSPKQYSDENRLQKFKAQIKKGDDLTDAMYEAGYGSSRGLYEKASAKIGMTPAVYKKGGQGSKIEYAVADCPLGKLLVGKTEKGVCSVTLGDTAEYLEQKLREEFPRAEIAENNNGLKTTVSEIVRHLEGKNKTLDLPLDLQATAFQMRVWAELRKIPYGDTRSYSEISRQISNEKAVRAVARACATNPVALVTPCHRVIAADGDLSGYRWGVERKRHLLLTESKNK